jgi:carbon-monoxide dehydrogenase medium subunit
MRPAPFDYIRANSVDEAVEALASHGQQARVLAGGQILVNLLRRRVERPATVVDVSRLEELRYVRLEGDSLAIGALTRLSDVAADPQVAVSCPALAEAAAAIGDVQVRNRGTIGGNVFPVPPDVSDIQPVLVASGGSIVVRDSEGTREIAAEDFVGARPEARLRPGELVVELRFGGVGSASAFEKLSRRAADPPIVNAAAFTRGDGSAWLTGAALGGAHEHVIRLHDLEADSAEQAFDAQRARRSLAALAEGLRPPSTAHAGSEYRRDVCGVLALRAIERALAGAWPTESRETWSEDR